MNATTKAIIDRLPKKPLLTPRDIADAYDCTTTARIYTDIRAGLLAANGLDKKDPRISYEAAVAYVRAKEITASEGTLPSTEKETP